MNKHQKYLENKNLDKYKIQQI